MKKLLYIIVFLMQTAAHAAIPAEPEQLRWQDANYLQSLEERAWGGIGKDDSYISPIQTLRDFAVQAAQAGDLAVSRRLLTNLLKLSAKDDSLFTTGALDEIAIPVGQLRALYNVIIADSDVDQDLSKIAVFQLGKCIEGVAGNQDIVDDLRHIIETNVKPVVRQEAVAALVDWIKLGNHLVNRREEGTDADFVAFIFKKREILRFLRHRAEANEELLDLVG